MDSETKTCSRCNGVKPVHAFGKNKTRHDGLCFYCKTCRSAYGKALRGANPEKERAYKKAWRGDNRERIRAYNKIWNADKYAANPEKYQALSKAWREANPEKLKALARSHYAANPEKSRAKAIAKIEALAVCYVRHLIKKGTPIKEVPQFLLEAKREHIKTVRLLKEQKK